MFRRAGLRAATDGDLIELEYVEDGELHPSRLLGETGGIRGASQTSPDLGMLVTGGRGLVLVENKFTERDFSRCSVRNHKDNSRGVCKSEP